MPTLLELLEIDAPLIQAPMAGVSTPETPDYPIAYDAGKALHAAAKAKGEFGYGAQWAGQGAPLSSPCRPASSSRSSAASSRTQAGVEGGRPAQWPRTKSTALRSGTKVSS
jgi:hypothetical protein